MGRVSSIDRLPEELKSRLIKLLKNPNCTQGDVTAIINEEAGSPVISKSAVNRYAVRMRKMIEKTRQAKEVAQVYLDETGDDTRGKLGKVINARVRMLAFDLTHELDDLAQSGEYDAKGISEIIQKVSRAVKELEQAEKYNAEREAQIRKAAMEEAAGAAEKALNQSGTASDAVRLAKQEILGLA